MNDIILPPPLSVPKHIPQKGDLYISNDNEIYILTEPETGFHQAFCLTDGHRWDRSSTEIEEAIDGLTFYTRGATISIT